MHCPVHKSPVLKLYRVMKTPKPYILPVGRRFFVGRRILKLNFPLLNCHEKAKLKTAVTEWGDVPATPIFIRIHKIWITYTQQRICCDSVRYRTLAHIFNQNIVVLPLPWCVEIYLTIGDRARIPGPGPCRTHVCPYRGPGYHVQEVQISLVTCV